MLREDGTRMLAYTEAVTNITPIEKADRLEAVHINGWVCVCGKGEFQIGDIGVFFEIDSKLPEVAPFTEMPFVVSKHYRIKSQKIRGQYSQGLFLPLSAFETLDPAPSWVIDLRTRIQQGEDVLHKDLTETLGVTYAVPADNVRKAATPDKYAVAKSRHPRIFQQSWAKWMMRRAWGRKILLKLFGSKKDSKCGWPVGRFPGVDKTDQERVENMINVLQDKTPFIITQKCDGSSATYILARVRKHKYEFYVCSRNVRFLKEDQQCFYDSNYYWEAAIKYDIENKMKDYLERNPDISFVCWQGEICAPGIQKNPHGLTATHLFCFHMTDSKTGRFDIREAKKIWDEYQMETVPIVDDNYILPDDLETLKLEADGLYDPSVCEGQTNRPREGFVYYKTTVPVFSFKNVSRKYLLKHG